MNDTRARITNCRNTYQKDFKRVLCVCSAGLLRSPTAALVLSQEPFNFNTRCAGLNDEYALIVIDNVLLTWADEIVCMTLSQKMGLEQKLSQLLIDTPVICLNIDDDYPYRDPILMRLIKDRYLKRGK